MKIQILFYTFGGATRKEAFRLTDELQNAGDVIKCTEITEKKNRSLLSSFFSGCPKALHRKASKIAPAQIEQDADRFIVGCPIWAGFPAPAFNAIIPLIPDGTITYGGNTVPIRNNFRATVTYFTDDSFPA